MPSLRKRVVNVFFGLDEAANAVFGGNPRETLSGSIGRAAEAGRWWAVWIARPALNFIMRDPRHCQEAVKAEAVLRAIGGGEA